MAFGPDLVDHEAGNVMGVGITPLAGLRHVVDPTTGHRIAAQEPPQGQHAPLEDAVNLDRLDRITSS